MLDNTRCSCECSHSVRRLLTFCQLVAWARGRGKVWRCGWGQAMPTPSGQLDSRHSRRGEATRGNAARLQIQPEALLNLSRPLPASLSAAASNVSLCATLACLKFQRIRSCAQRASNGICRSQPVWATAMAMPPLPGRQPGSSRRSPAAQVSRVQATKLIIILLVTRYSLLAAPWLVTSKWRESQWLTQKKTKKPAEMAICMQRACRQLSAKKARFLQGNS